MNCAGGTCVVILRSRRNLIGNFVKCLSTGRIFCGDSTLSQTYKDAGFNKEQDILADILFTDPPYCLLTRRRKLGDLRDPKMKAHKRKIDFDPAVPRFENISEYIIFTENWLSTCLSHALKPNADLVIWTNALGKKIISDCAAVYGYKLVGEYLWAKKSKRERGDSLRSELTLRVYETALIFSNKKYDDERILSLKSLPWSVVWGYHDTVNASAPHSHPCHKPLAVLEPLLLTWTKAGDVILDPFSGSGSIAVAALKVGSRSVIGIERLSQWVEYARDEMEKLN